MKAWKNILRTLGFLLGLLFLVECILYTLRPKRGDGILDMYEYYNQAPDTVDVLLVGSSRIASADPANVLWQTQGIAAYTLWGSIQTFWSTYHYLVEALKYQRPKVVVLDVHAVIYSDLMLEYCQVTNTTGLRWSRNRIAAIWDAAAPEERLDLLLELPLTHEAYDELTAEDFRHYPWSPPSGGKGDFGPSCVVRKAGARDRAEIAAIKETMQLSEKNEEFLKKIIELCLARGIPILLMNTPDTSATIEQPYYNRVSEIAGSYGVPYLNYNVMETSFVREVSFLDGGHLNTVGARSISGHLGSYLKETYDLPSHTGDPAWGSWEEYTRRWEASYLKLFPDLPGYAVELAGNGYLSGGDYGYRYYITESRKQERPEENSTALLNDALLKIGCDLSAGQDGLLNTWVVDSLDAGKTQYAASADAAAGLDMDGVHFAADAETGEITVNGETVGTITGEGVTITVYDPWLEEVVDCVEFPGSTSYAARR